MEYKPDRWVLLKLDAPEGILFKVLAGWSGSYLEGQSWKINSGITSITMEDDYYLFKGYSGSVYKCHKNGYGCNMIMNGIVDQIQEKFKDKAEIMDDQDFMKLNIQGESNVK